MFHQYIDLLNAGPDSWHNAILLESASALRLAAAEVPHEGIAADHWGLHNCLRPHVDVRIQAVNSVVEQSKLYH